MANWEYCSVHLHRRCNGGPWQAVVPPDSGPGELVGWDLVLNHYGAYGWELVGLLPLAFQVDGQGLEARAAFAIFKRRFDLNRLREQVVQHWPEPRG